MYKIITIGEALIDFIPNQKGCMLKEVTGFERVAGGAPANVAAAVAKLSGNAYFISQLGQDAFGDHIVDVLNEANVNTDYVLRTNKANTGLAFVSLKEDGNRDFSFYRNPSADMLLEDNQIQEEWFKDCKVLHFCSVDLVESPMKYAHKKAIEYASNNNAIISFDPNVRLPLWENHEECRSVILEFLPMSHIVKISDEELEFITGIKDESEALESLFVGNVKAVIYTKGPDGACFITRKNGIIKNVEGKGIKVKAIDTTGAGDSFIGSFLYQLGRKNINLSNIEDIDEKTLEGIIAFSNKYAADTTTKKGAISAMCTLKDLE
ncbi:carbohydrate kinase [Romboutsia weinsteinii]|uniref:Carbohydrate kinase n=1 Tax=Romboutsia weinsteinii TaxID=2020949 RepID=A0A371J8H9_9FIRM|nr:carbohydrate kinase [Romboutsia weinsteinii]RDY28977.1 carbohydrate kinase [Romboutsia weinsteinii]